ncbi:HTH_Tnp_Tc3_2 domain-containing protein [Trichonephila clavipes]|nr:HTH_Tnp_Tc3_2 domain-containing protein [Trichonephila clavipes]
MWKQKHVVGHYVVVKVVETQRSERGPQLDKGPVKHDVGLSTPNEAQKMIKHKTNFISLAKPKISSRVGRNQTTVMRICDRWMQEGLKDRSGRSHPSQYTTSRKDRQIVRMSVTDRSITSRTVAQHIESATHHSVSARTI